MNPGTGRVIQRRARPRPYDCTLPAAASESSARCTVRWLAPSASARAELDHDSPSARKASTAACSSSTGRASTTTSLARRGTSANPRFVALTPASVRSAVRSRPIFDSQPCAMRFIGVLCSECPRDERAPRHVSGPRLAQRACEREQHRTPCERDHRACVTHDMAARVHDERPRRQQRFNILEQEESLVATRNQARRGRVQDEGCAFDLRRQRRDICGARGALGPSERRARRLRPKASHRDPRNDQLVGGPRRGREGRRVELGERKLGLVEAPDQEEAPDLEMPRMRGVHPVAVLFERRPRCVERLRRPAQVARDERDLGLGDDTPRAGHGLFRTEGARRTSQESLRSNEIAEPRHRDAAQRERRRVVAQRDPVQGAEGITRGDRTRRGRDQRSPSESRHICNSHLRQPAAKSIARPPNKDVP